MQSQSAIDFDLTKYTGNNNSSMIYSWHFVILERKIIENVCFTYKIYI